MRQELFAADVYIAYLFECEGHVSEDGDGFTKFVVESHEQHGVQAVHKSQAPSVEAVSGMSHGSEDEWNTTHLFTALLLTGSSSSFDPAYLTYPP